jgi:hypothetical protein
MSGRERVVTLYGSHPTVQGGMDCALPRMVRVEQRFPRPKVADIRAELAATVQALPRRDLAGKRVAITCGSRGIPSAADIMAELVAVLKESGATPFIIPAMGSHGGASAEGQRRVIEDYGITERRVNAPILASMEVVQVGELPEGVPLYCDALARGADGIVLFNKIMPHSAYKAPIESGLIKMAAIGLGKHRGASTLHTFGFDEFPRILRSAGEHLIRTLPVVFGLAVLENAYGELASLEAIPAERIPEREPELLAEAKRIMSRLLLPAIDVLVVDEFGKDVSGAGLDPNVTGRPATRRPGFHAPPIQKIIVRDLTPASHGNAAGIGMADFTTLRCVEKIDLGISYTNVFTARVMDSIRIPVVLSSDRETIVVALKTCNRVTPENARVVRIRNTKSLHVIAVSESCLPDIEGRSDLAVLSPPYPMEFDAAGYLIDPL